MVDAHNVSHLLYMSWCAACVRELGINFPHKRIKRRQDNLPVMSCDYLIAERKTATVVFIDGDTHVIFAHIMPQKGVDPAHYSVDALFQDVAWLGYIRFSRRSDNEPAILLLLTHPLTEARFHIEQLEQVM